MLSVWAPNIRHTEMETEWRYRRFTLTHESHKKDEKEEQPERNDEISGYITSKPASPLHIYLAISIIHFKKLVIMML